MVHGKAFFENANMLSAYSTALLLLNEKCFVIIFSYPVLLQEMSGSRGERRFLQVF